jgi:hypothetical protein
VTFVRNAFQVCLTRIAHFTQGIAQHF